MNPKRKNSIKKSLIVRMGGLTAAAGLLIGLASGIILYIYSSNAMRERINESVTSYWYSIQNALKLYEEKAETVAKNTMITDSRLSLQDRKSNIASLALGYGFTNIIVTDMDGWPIDGSSTDYSKQDCFQNAKEGKTAISR